MVAAYNVESASLKENQSGTIAEISLPLLSRQNLYERNHPVERTSRSTHTSIVIADEDNQFMELMTPHIIRWGYQVVGVRDKESLFLQITRERPALLLLNVRFGQHDGIEILRQLVADYPKVRVIILTASGTIESAISAIKLGASDYLTKPFDPARLESIIRHDIDQPKRSPDQPTGRGNQHSPPSTCPKLSRPILGASRAAVALRDRIAAVALTDATVLILGESGTGKELVARALHELSPRRARPFVPLNVAALPRELVESTLFGHEKGAFTGADQPQRGCCEEADTGTLFLDEIGEMEIGLQAKLLRFLQERTFHRVGRSTLTSVNVRVIAATNRDPLEQIRRGMLRDDLYYRLNVVPITVPPLRDRREDIPVLARHFLHAAAARYNKPEVEFTPAAFLELVGFDWPGNVRQLENMIERLVVLNRENVLDLSALVPELHEEKRLPDRLVDASEIEKELGTIDRMEKQAIIEALRCSDGKVRAAARTLGIGQATVYRKLKRYGIPI